MQPGKFSSELCEDILLFAKQREKRMSVEGLRHFVRRVSREGIHFVVPEDITTTPDVKDYDLTQYGALRPPYSVVVVEYITEFEEGDRMPTVIVAMDMPEQKEVWWTYSIKELVPSKTDPTKTHFIWRVPVYSWAVPYEHCGKFSEDGVAQFVMSPNRIICSEAHKELVASSGMNYSEYISAHATAAAVFFEIYAGFCAVMHEHEVTFDTVEPDEKTNRLRRARGKVPLFTYKVLTVGKKKRKSRRRGGTHASPRSHLRRGYYRTSRKGVRHWVQPCMVKGNTDGFVHKDYRVEGQSQ